MTHRFRRADCPIDRIVVTRPDGFISFAALKWLHGVGCGIVQLDYDGTVIFAPAPAGPDQPALRHAQALAAGDEIGLTVTREILRVKLRGQAEVAGLLGSEETAGLIVRLAGEIAGVGDSAQILATRPLRPLLIGRCGGISRFNSPAIAKSRSTGGPSARAARR